MFYLVASPAGLRWVNDKDNVNKPSASSGAIQRLPFYNVVLVSQ